MCITYDFPTRRHGRKSAFVVDGINADIFPRRRVCALGRGEIDASLAFRHSAKIDEAIQIRIKSQRCAQKVDRFFAGVISI